MQTRRKMQHILGPQWQQFPFETLEGQHLEHILQFPFHSGGWKSKHTGDIIAESLVSSITEKSSPVWRLPFLQSWVVDTSDQRYQHSFYVLPWRQQDTPQREGRGIHIRTIKHPIKSEIIYCWCKLLTLMYIVPARSMGSWMSIRKGRARTFSTCWPIVFLVTSMGA